MDVHLALCFDCCPLNCVFDRCRKFPRRGICGSLHSLQLCDLELHPNALSVPQFISSWRCVTQQWCTETSGWTQNIRIPVSHHSDVTCFPLFNSDICTTYSSPVILCVFLNRSEHRQDLKTNIIFFTATLITLHSAYSGEYRRIAKSAEGGEQKTECNINYVAITV